MAKKSKTKSKKTAAFCASRFVAGPRKKASAKTGPATSTHKRRSGWFQSRESWPWREVAPTYLTHERARTLAAVPQAAGTEQWTPVGPTNIGGRMTSIVCNPNDPRKLVVGSAGGGIWTSDDGGLTWIGRWHQEPTLNIGSLALDPQNPNIIYCGTGEANLSADSHPGVGLFRSLDAGSSWHLLADAEANGLPTRIGALAVDPFDGSHLALGGVSHSSGSPTGMFISHDGGGSWAFVRLVGTRGYRCHCVVFHPTKAGHIYATITANGVSNGIWRTKNGGQTWKHLTSGLPSSHRIGRTSLAIAPSNPKVVYALCCDTGDGVLGVFRSNNRGTSWSEVSGGKHFRSEGQMSYNNTIAVHPADEDTVICGGVDLHRTRNGGRTWKTVTRWDADRGSSNYAHADHHALLMPAGNPGWVFDMNDGGMDFSSDSGTNWSNRSNGLETNMSYDLSVSQSDADFIMTGLQDNGTVATFTGSADDYTEVTGGDGGFSVIDESNPAHFFTSWQGMNIIRFRLDAAHPRARVKNVTPNASEGSQMWMVFMALDPDDSKTLYTGSDRVWKTTSDGDNWSPVSLSLDGSPITSIEVCPADSNRLYVGTENGGIFRSTDAGSSWSGNIASTELPGKTVTRIRTAPDDADNVFATVAGFGNRHVFRSTNGGDSWADVDNGELPDAPFHSIAVRQDNPKTIYVCGDLGVFVSTNSGGTWKNMSRNLPNVMVVDIVYHRVTKTLTATTYGRSTWRIKVSAVESSPQPPGTRRTPRHRCGLHSSRLLNHFSRFFR